MKQSVLWKLERDGNIGGFVLGTMHVKSIQAFRRVDMVQDIINDCELFGAEYHLNELTANQDASALKVPEGQTLLNLLRDRKYARIQKVVQKSFNIDLNQFQSLLPLVIVNILSESVLTKDFQLPLDFYLWNYAESQGLELVGIETYLAQTQVLKKIKIDDQLKMLKDISRMPVKYRKNILKMAEWYQNEDILRLYKSGRKSLGKYKSILLTNRNFIMARRFEELAKNKRIFFAIGAGHLAGNKGVLKLLKDRNWKLEAL